MKTIFHRLTILLFACTLIISLFSFSSNVEAATNWKKIYRNYISKDSWCKESATSAKLIYINNDSIPEVFIEGNCAAAGNLLLTIYKGKVYKHYIDGHGGLDYVKKKGLIYMYGGHMDNYDDSVGKLIKGKIVVKSSGEYGAVDNSNVKYDKKGHPIYKYYWNNKKVSESSYNKKLKAAKGGYKYSKSYIYGKMLSMNQLKKKLK